MLKYFLSILICFFILPVKAQWESPARLELNAGDKLFSIVRSENQNLIIISAPEKDNGISRKKWTFTVIGTNLRLIWEQQADLVSDHQLQSSETVGQVTYVMFCTSEKRKFSGPDYQLVILDHKEQKLRIINGKTDEKAYFAAFDIIGQNIFSAFNIRNGKSVIYINNSINDEINKVIPFPENESLIFDLKAERTSEYFVIAANSSVSKKKDQLVFLSFTKDGQPWLNCPVEISENQYRLIDGYLDVSPPANWTLTGIFNHQNDRTTTDNSDEKLANGVCYVRTSNGALQTQKFYNFIDFDNIEEIFNKQDGLSVFKKIEKEKKKDRDRDLKFNTILLPPVNNEGNHFFLTEIYSTEYQIVNRYSYDFYGRVYPQSYSVFDGYRFYNAFTGEFDIEGNLLWTNGLIFRDIKNFELTSHAEIYNTGQNIVLVYSADGKIASKVINKFTETGPFERTGIQLKYQEDQLVNEAGSQIEHWHNNYFVAYGLQTIRNSSLNASTRKVFYLNKIALDL